MKNLQQNFSKNPAATVTKSSVLERFSSYPKLGHLDAGETGIDCVPVSVLMNLTANLESWNRLIFLNSNEKMSGRKM